MILKLKELRNFKKLSISQVSYKSGITRSYLAELENGKYFNPSLNIICKLCKALQITPNELINKDYWSW